MKVRALRGVCIGIERHMKPGDTEDLDAATVTFLVGIGAVERVPEPVVEPASAKLALDETESKQPEKSGKAKEK